MVGLGSLLRVKTSLTFPHGPCVFNPSKVSVEMNCRRCRGEVQAAALPGAGGCDADSGAQRGHTHRRRNPFWRVVHTGVHRARIEGSRRARTW